MTEVAYVGSELDLFAHASNWKSYFSKRISPFLAGEVLEVGAGIGGSTTFLAKSKHSGWLCLEPDPNLSGRLRATIDAGSLPDYCDVMTGTTVDLPAMPRFDTILYLDVMEHIEDDFAEMQRASGLLRSGGRIIILCPAHQWLFSPFDAGIGHFRRYDTKLMRRLSTPELQLDRLEYLDSVGMLASITNRMLLKQSLPTSAQIAFWDRVMVPFSRPLDFLLRYTVGKSILGVWTHR